MSWLCAVALIEEKGQGKVGMVTGPLGTHTQIDFCETAELVCVISSH